MILKCFSSPVILTSPPVHLSSHIFLASCPQSLNKEVLSPILSVHLTWQRNSVEAHIPVCVHLQSESTRQSIWTKVLGFFKITILRFLPTPKNRLQKKSSHKSFPESMDQQPTDKSTSCVVKAVHSSVWRAETIYGEPLKESSLLKPLAVLQQPL